MRKPKWLRFGSFLGPFSMDAVPHIEWCEEEGYFRLTGRYGAVIHIPPKVFLPLARRLGELSAEWLARQSEVVRLPKRKKGKRATH